MKKRRIPIPKKTEDEVIYKCARTCCVCRIPHKPIIIHHIDEDPSNNIEANLVVLCTECHNTAHSRLYLTKNLDIRSLKFSKTYWEKEVSRRNSGYNLDSQEEKKISISRLPSTGAYLFGRDGILQKLHDAWNSPNINVLTLVAGGGVGKTALINYWLNEIEKANYNDAEKIFAWSFYTQGVTDFIEYALNWFGDTGTTWGTSWEKGERLARLIRQYKCILIIDGLEPLQYPPGPNEGTLKDPALIAMFRELAAYNPGLCIVSTRLHIADISQFEKTTAPKIDLDYLTQEAGAQLLSYHGVKGSQIDLESTSNEYGGHSLALTLLGCYIRDVYNGDILKKKNVSLLDEDAEMGGHAKRVMASYEKWFGEGVELSILRLLGLFDRPVNNQVIACVREGSLIIGLTEFICGITPIKWNHALSRLVRAKLISISHIDSHTIIDTHPLIREYFNAQLLKENEIAWKEGNRRLFEYYKNSAISNPYSIEEMEPLFLSIIHGCKAGKYQEALDDIYKGRIIKADKSCDAEEFGAIGLLLLTISYFFENGIWGKPVPLLSNSDKRYILTEAGRFLTELKGYSISDVGLCYEEALKLCDNKEEKLQHFEILLGLCRYHRVRGDLRLSGILANKLVNLYSIINKPYLYSSTQRALATNYFYMGEFSLALEHSRNGASIICDDRQQAFVNAHLDVNEPSLSCLGYCALSLWFLGYSEESILKCNETVQYAQKLGHPHTLAIVLLIEAMTHHFCMNVCLTEIASHKLTTLCAEKGFMLWFISGEILNSWSISYSTDDVYSILEQQKRIKRNINSWLDQEARLFTPYWFGILADVSIKVKDMIGANEAIDKGLIASKKNGEHWWDAELYRLKGEVVMLELVDKKIAGQYILKAIKIAQTQGAHSLLLRAKLTLAKFSINLDSKNLSESTLIQ